MAAVVQWLEQRTVDPWKRVRFSPAAFKQRRNKMQNKNKRTNKNTYKELKDKYNMTLELAKGTRDISGEDEILKQELLSKLKTIFERYGFNPLNTTILERLDSLTSKYAGGEEITKEIFKLKDQGDRDLGLRYDLTVPFARFVGMNKDLKMPFKRYEMGVVFRDGPIKLGRYREFWQCDVDMVGCPYATAEVELMSLVKDFFDSLNLKVKIKINSINVLNAMMEKINIPESLRQKTILIIDKLEKFGVTQVKKELEENSITKEQIESIIDFITFEGNNKQKLDFLKTEIGESPIQEITEIIRLTNSENIEFDISLARGLSYYTGTIFEVYLQNSELKSSIAAGGRYDKMISNFLNTTQPYPTVGIAFGLSVIIDALKLERKENTKKTVTKVYIIPINTQGEALKLAQKLRNNNINTELDLNNKSISKNLDYANYYKIPYVIILGEDEIKKQEYKLKDMLQGKEEFLREEQLIKKLQK